MRSRDSDEDEPEGEALSTATVTISVKETGCFSSNFAPGKQFNAAMTYLATESMRSGEPRSSLRQDLQEVEIGFGARSTREHLDRIVSDLARNCRDPSLPKSKTWQVTVY